MSLRSLEAIVLALMLTVLAPGATSQVEMDVTVGLGEAGLVPGRWTLLRVDLKGDDVDRRLRVEAHAPSGRPEGCRLIETLDLAAGDRKSIQWPIYVPEGGAMMDLRVDAYQGRRRLATFAWDTGDWLPPDARTVPPPPEGTDPLELPLVVALGTKAGLGVLLEADAQDPARRRAVVEKLLPSQAPTQALGFDSAVLVVVPRPRSAGLSPEAWQALEHWVRGGGQLLLYDLQEPWPPSVFPLSEAVPRQGPARMQRLGELLGGRVPSEATGPVLPLDRGAGEDFGEGVAVRVPCSFGSVITLAVPLEIPGVAGVLRDAGLAEFLLGPPPPEPDSAAWIPPWYLSSEQEGRLDQDMTQALSKSPATRAPPPGLILLALGLLALWIGPGESFRYRWTGRWRWTWLTLPASVALVSGGLIWGSYRLLGDTVAAEEVHLVSWDPVAGYAAEERWISIFPGTSGRFRVELSPPGSGLAPVPERRQVYSPLQAPPELPGGTVTVERSGAGSAAGGRLLRLMPRLLRGWSAAEPAAEIVAGLEWFEEGEERGIRNRGDATWVLVDSDDVGNRSRFPPDSTELPPGWTWSLPAARPSEAPAALPPDAPEAAERSWEMRERLSRRAGLSMPAVTAESGPPLFLLAVACGWPLEPSEQDPERFRLHGLHGWDGYPWRMGGRRVVALAARVGKGSVSGDREVQTGVWTVVRLLVPEEDR